MPKDQPTIRRSAQMVFSFLLATALLAFTLLNVSSASAHSATLSSNAPSQQPPDFNGPGKAHVVQDPAWVKAKLGYRVFRQGQSVVIGNAVSPLAYPASALLTSCNTVPYCANTAYEPPRDAYDTNGTHYTDGYYSNFCGAGASTVTEFFWNQSRVAYWPAGNFTEPSTANYHKTTYWGDNDLRAYIMYLAEQVSVPGWTIPGEVSFGNYPYAGTRTEDLRDTLNWEASGHNTSNWQTFFYIKVPYSSLSASQLNSDVEYDLVHSAVPLVAVVTTSYLPSWSTGGIPHAISIIGYDNTNSTYTYVETCGSDGCGSKGQGVYTISQSALYSAIQNDRDSKGNYIGALVW